MTLDDLLTAQTTGVYSPASLHMLLKAAFGTPLDAAERSLHAGIIREDKSYGTDTPTASVIDAASGVWEINTPPGARPNADVVEHRTVPEIRAEEVDAWVREKTRGLVERLELDNPAGLIKLVVNTLYLKAFWDVPFMRERTEEGTFHGVENPYARVEYMHQGSATFPVQLPVYQVAEYKVFRLPYRDKNLVFEVCLPDREELLPEALSIWKRPEEIPFAPTACVLMFPKFQLTSKIEFSPIKLLRRFPQYVSYAKGIPLMDVVIQQATKIIVDERGTEAAAATMFGMRGIPRERDHLQIFVNRPFAFRIFDRSLGLELFRGVVLDL